MKEETYVDPIPKLCFYRTRIIELAITLSTSIAQI